jgi:hypothetical protein
MGIDQLSERLSFLHSNLTVRWEDLRMIWDDSVRRDFEQHYIEPLRVQVEGLRRVMDDLGTAVEYARNVMEGK